jgi:hypothetical protein
MGFDYPIGLYRLSDSKLLTTGLVHAGVGDTLIERFRYVDTPDVRLEVGRDYVIAWYTTGASMGGVDWMFSALPTVFAIDPVITRSPHTRVQLPFMSSGGLAMPTLIATDHKVGPNFLFVPEPSAVVVGAIAGFGLLLRRTRHG